MHNQSTTKFYVLGNVSVLEYVFSQFLGFWLLCAGCTFVACLVLGKVA